MNLLAFIKSAFSEPDPLRFSHLGEPAPGWHGEFAALPKKTRGLIEERVVIDSTGKVEFREQGFGHLNIPKELTTWEREMLAGGWNRKRYDPNNPAYSKAKAIFADNPHITNAELSEKSGVNQDTVKDVAAIFRCSFETLLRSQK